MFAVGVSIWIAWTLRYISRGRRSADRDAASGYTPKPSRPSPAASPSRDAAPRGHSVARAPADGGVCVRRASVSAGDSTSCRPRSSSAGSPRASSAGWVWTRTVAVYLEGMESLLPAALMVGVARSISIVLEDGRVIDTILNGAGQPALRRAAARRRRADGAVPRADSHCRAERQRTGGVDDAAVRADGGRAGLVASGAGARVPDRRRADGAGDARPTAR